MVISGIQPLENLELMRHVPDVLGRVDKAWSAGWNARGLAAIEAAVGETAGKYCVGDEPSIADIYLVPQLYGARRFEVSLEAMPTLTRIEAACRELPAFADSHPERQPDASR
jgi:maleylpyruvate isomerase